MSLKTELPTDVCTSLMLYWMYFYILLKFLIITYIQLQRLSGSHITFLKPSSRHCLLRLPPFLLTDESVAKFVVVCRPCMWLWKTLHWMLGGLEYINIGSNEENLFVLYSIRRVHSACLIAFLLEIFLLYIIYTSAPTADSYVS